MWIHETGNTTQKLNNEKLIEIDKLQVSIGKFFLSIHLWMLYNVSRIKSPRENDPRKIFELILSGFFD